MTITKGKPKEQEYLLKGEDNSGRKLSVGDDLPTGLENKAKFTIRRGHETAFQAKCRVRTKGGSTLGHSTLRDRTCGLRAVGGKHLGCKG